MRWINGRVWLRNSGRDGRLRWVGLGRGRDLRVNKDGGGGWVGLSWRING